MTTTVAPERERPPARGRGTRGIIAAGVVGAMLFMAGMAAYLALVTPPYAQDEAAHVGYSMSILDGELPSIDTRIPTERDEDLRIAVERPRVYAQHTIHVANNPPYPYLVAIPAMELTSAADVAGGPLLGLRLLDLLGAVAAVGLTFLLGRELTDDAFVGLTAAGLLAGVVAVSTIVSLANVDGLALAATVGVTFGLARFARTRALRDATWLGLWCAAAAAVRPMSLAFAALAGVIALLLGLGQVRRSGRAGSPADWARALWSLLVRLGGPTILVAGWFYALNVSRYGDFTGSQALLDKLGWPNGPPLVDVLTHRAAFAQPLTYLITEVYGRNLWLGYRGPRQFLVSGAAVALVLLSIGLAFRSSRRASRDGARSAVSPAAWVSVAIVSASPYVLLAEHIHNGGSGHARYLLPMLPIIAVAAAVVATKISRWAAVAVVLSFAIAHLTRIRAAGNTGLRPLRQVDPQGLPLAVIGQPGQALCIAVGIAGFLVLMAALVTCSVRSRARPIVDEDPRGTAAAVSPT